MRSKQNIQEGFSLLQYFKTNYGWISAVIALFSTITGFLIRLNDYLNFTFLCSFFGLSTEYYQANEFSILYTIGMSILLLASLSSLIYCYYNLYKFIFKKGSFHISDTLIILIVTAFSAYTLSEGKILSWYFFILFFCFNITGCFATFTVCKFIKLDRKNTLKIENNSYEENIDNLKNYFKILPWFIIASIIISAVLQFFSMIMENNYYIIDSNKTCQVIVYTTNDYSLSLDCKIDNKSKLIIYKGTQTKLVNNNVKTKKITFSEVNVVNSKNS